MKALFAAEMIAMIAMVGCSATPCARGTVFLSLHYTDETAAADALDVALSVAGGAVEHRQVMRRPGLADDSVALRFSAGYPDGSSVTLTVTALLDSKALGSNSDAFTADGSCSARSLTVAASMTPTFVAQSSLHLHGVKALSLPALAGVEQGDFLYLVLFAIDRSVSLTVPAGWSPLTSTAPATASYQASWYTKVAGASETAPSITSSANASQLSAALLAYRGAATPQIDAQSATPTDTPGTSTTDAISFVAAAPTAAATDLAVLSVAYESGDAEHSVTSPPGFDLRVDLGELAIYDGPAVATSQLLTASLTWSSGDSNDGSTFVVDLR